MKKDYKRLLKNCRNYRQVTQLSRLLSIVNNLNTYNGNTSLVRCIVTFLPPTIVQFVYLSAGWNPAMTELDH